jgi:hypothetical protein
MTRKQTPNAYDIYNLGWWMAKLEDSSEGGSWGMIKICLEQLARYRDIHSLEFVGKDAFDQCKEYAKSYNKEVDDITSIHSELLRGSVNWWQGRVDEVSKGWVLHCPEAEIDTDKLTKGAKAFISDEEWRSLSLLEQGALDETIACLLSNTFTAAEFMALRLVESLLRRWYTKRTGKEPGRLQWFGILDELNEEFPKDKRPKELSLLDYLRERRNEIAHPDIISQSYEATATFFNVITLFRAIKTELANE